MLILKNEWPLFLFTKSFSKAAEFLYLLGLDNSLFHRAQRKDEAWGGRRGSPPRPGWDWALGTGRMDWKVFEASTYAKNDIYSYHAVH